MILRWGFRRKGAFLWSGGFAEGDGDGGEWKVCLFVCYELSG